MGPASRGTLFRAFGGWFQGFHQARKANSVDSNDFNESNLSSIQEFERSNEGLINQSIGSEQRAVRGMPEEARGSSFPTEVKSEATMAGVSRTSFGDGIIEG
jgi:hypothetical protein